MDDRAEMVNRLTDMQDAITLALKYLDGGELAKAWRILQDQEESNSLRSLLAESEEAAYLDFQRRTLKPAQGPSRNAAS